MGARSAEWVKKWLRAIGADDRKNVRGLVLSKRTELILESVVRFFEVDVELSETYEVHEDE